MKACLRPSHHKILNLSQENPNIDSPYSFRLYTVWGGTIYDIFRHCEAGASRIDSVRPSLVRLPSKILKIEFPTCHVTAMALKTGLFVHR